MSAVTRRAAIGAGAAVLAAAVPTVAVGVTVSTNSDAELIALCHQFSALQAQINDHWRHSCREKSWYGPTYIEDDDDRDAADEPLKEQQDPIIARICALTPKTLEGSKAVARCLALWDSQVRTCIEFGCDGDNVNVNDILVAVLVRGLTDNLEGIS